MKPCSEVSETIKLCSAVNKKFGDNACVGHTLRSPYCVAWSECRQGDESKDLAIIDVE